MLTEILTVKTRIGSFLLRIMTALVVGLQIMHVIFGRKFVYILIMPRGFA